jgi:parallel beta-helix repeat protein
MKRKKAIGLIIFIVLIHLINYVPLISAQTVYIDPNDNIQQIINNIEPYTTIFLNEGEYHQTFQITKPLHLTARNPALTIINATSKTNKPAIIISSSKVLISNITIQNNGPGLYTSGVRILKDESTIQDCVFTDTPIGISIWANNNTILNCQFINCSDEGIVLLSTMISTANNNFIGYCKFVNNCDGIEMQQSSMNTIDSCIFNNNYHSGIDGINSNNNNNIIQNCTITNNSVHGIYITNSQNNTIKDSYFYNNTDGNIITPQSTSLKLDNNIFKEDIQKTGAFSEPISSTIKQPRKTSSIRSIVENFLSFISNIFSFNK